MIWDQKHDYKKLLDENNQVIIDEVPTLYGIALLGTSTPKAMCVGYGQYAFTLAASDFPNFDACIPDEIPSGQQQSTSDTWVQRDVEAQSEGVDEDPAFFTVAKISSDSACLGGAFGRIVTYDESATPKFEDRATRSHNRLRDAAFIRDSSFDKGVACGQGWTIWDTDDSGATWHLSPQSPSWSFDPGNWAMGIDVSTSGAHGVCVGTAGFVAHGTFSGVYWSWEQLQVSNSEIPANLPDLNAVAFVPGSLTVYAVGNVGRVIKSTDGGATWANLRQTSSDALNGVSFIDPSTGYVVGASGKVFKTTDGGTTWSSFSVSGNPTTTFHDVAAWSVSGGDQAYLVGAGGAVYHKSTSATSFSTVSTGLGQTTDLLDVEVLNAGQNVRIGGDLGTALFLDSSSWTSLKSGTTFPIHRMFFNDATHGFAVGSMFVIAKYE